MADEEKLGIDIGGVIIDRVNDKKDTSFFGDNYLNTTPVPGAFEAIKRLVDERFHENVYLVSKCGPEVEGKTKKWLEHHQFFERTGVRRENVFFVRDRRDKAVVCADKGVTHFIDDKLEVLGWVGKVKTMKRKYLFRPRKREIEEFYQFMDKNTKIAYAWDVVVSDLLG